MTIEMKNETSDKFIFLNSELFLIDKTNEHLRLNISGVGLIIYAIETHKIRC
jgi:hypothetical protein